MSVDCLVCESYADIVNREIDYAGREHRRAMEEIREKEARGSDIAPIIRTPQFYEEYARRTDFDHIYWCPEIEEYASAVGELACCDSPELHRNDP